jgi:hypothetical protein
MELPHVEKLRQLAKTKNIEVISFNVDANPGIVAPFAKAKNLSLPVLLARELVEGFTGMDALPTSWIVDKNGKVVEALTGSMEKPTWAEDMLKRLEAM